MSAERKPAIAEAASDAVPPAAVVEIFPDLPLAPGDPNELHRYLGYPAGVAPSPRVADRISRVLAQAASSLRPRGVYALYAVTHQTEHSLQLGGVAISGKIGDFLRQSQRVAVFVVTVGEEISTLSEAAARTGDAFSAWVMDALGSWATEQAADNLMQRIRHHLDEGQELTLRYSPGYCGMSIAQQRNLFRLVPAEAAKVTLTPSLLMRPLKSISGLVGLAPREAMAQYHSPCDLCLLARCPMRR